MIFRAACLCFAVLAPRLTAAQVPAVSIVPAEEVIFLDEGGEMPMQEPQPAPAETAAAAKPSSKPSARAEKLKKLEFDRRPSTILKAWANPPKSKEPEKPATEPPPPPAADPAAPGDPEAEKQRAADAEKARKAAEETARKAAEARAIEEELGALQRNVTLGRWAEVAGYLAGLTDDEKKAGYEQLLASLQKGPSQRPPNVPQQGQNHLEKNRFALEDVLGLVAAAPLSLGKEQLAKLGAILRQALDSGTQLDSLLAALRPGVDAADARVDRRKLAQLLAAANELVAAGEFLPALDQAEAQNDREGLNLLARHFLAGHAKDQKTEWLEKAWRATQIALAAGDVKEEEKTEALTRAVELAPRIAKELGQAWLDESFTARPERGMEILAAIGTSAALGLQSQPMQDDLRLKWLQLQSAAAKALLAAAPERAAEWRMQLSVLAANWLREALFTYQFDSSTSLGPKMQRDVYGNFYYFDMQNQFRGNQPTPIKTGAMLETRPDQRWMALIDEAQRPRLQQVIAQLLLKVSEDAEAFPFIEELARSHPRPGKELADEFLRVWAKNHDPNASQQRQNRYVYFYGFEERANGIPLTRSKQERNLVELAEWVARLRELPIEIDTGLVVAAFTAAHSTAEVYRIETIERIFGSLKALEPSTLAGLVQQMRANLVSIWRDPAKQKDAKTNRGQKDIQAEVLHGYQLAHATVDRALADHPGNWQLMLADAAIRHDENNYLLELKKDPEFSARRQQAMELFARSAEAYIAGTPGLARDKESTQVFETWFYAALGACDLNKIDAEKQLAAQEIPRIRAALLRIPGESGQRHMDAFTTGLFSRMSSAAPAIKFRYVREGLALVGDSKLAHEARQLYDYYKDLVTEIRLETRIDGSDRVGHEQPFGLQVNLRHTREIEREAGGFAKYLQNQNTQGFAYNYGRPLEDYRDKFEEAARGALKEDFDVLSVTFNAPEVKSIATAEYGWRVTPYAYLLLKPRGPEIDRVPPLRLDLDFLDTSGYAVLPIESPVLPIDAAAGAGEERPFEKLHLTQTLDERQAKDGKLILEVKATANGLVPALETLVDFQPGDFSVQRQDDPGVSVTRFDEEGEGSGVVSERTWTMTLRPREGLERLPTSFAFAKPRLELAGDEHFRYVDADLAAVGPVVELENRYGTTRKTWLYWTAGIVLLALGGTWFLRRAVRTETKAEQRFRQPESITPFTVLGLLRDIEQNDGLEPGMKHELRAEIDRIEEHYFGDTGSAQPDLAGIASTWVGRVG